jgi:hypothetical protein
VKIGIANFIGPPESTQKELSNDNAAPFVGLAFHLALNGQLRTVSGDLGSVMAESGHGEQVIRRIERISTRMIAQAGFDLLPNRNPGTENSGN